MSIYTPSVGEWVNPLRNLALGISMASLLLVPTSYPIPLVEQQPIQSEIDVVVTLPDGFVDLRTIYYRTPFGLETPVLQETVQRKNDKIELERIPHILRDMSGLPVETLASLAHVSRNAYYKWLDGKGVSDEHARCLTELLDTFHTISALHGSNLKEFLEASGPAGRPIDLLTAGMNDVVIGLAFRHLPNYIDSDRVSKTARDISGLPGWVRPAVKLNWGAPHLSATELDRALDLLSPRPQFSQVESFGNTDGDDEAFVAWGLVLE